MGQVVKIGGGLLVLFLVLGMLWIVSMANDGDRQQATLPKVQAAIRAMLDKSQQQVHGAEAAIEREVRSRIAVGQQQADARQRADAAARASVRLKAGQECVGGTVVQRFTTRDGTQAAAQLLEFGKPVPCSGQYRVPSVDRQ